MDVSNYRVRSGTTRVSRGGVVTNVTKIFVHPSYIPDITHDFALVNLKKALAFNARTQVIKLPPSSSYRVSGGVPIFMVGHGLTLNPLHSQELLKGVVTTVKDYAACKEAWGGTLQESMICVNNDNPKAVCSVS